MREVVGDVKFADHLSSLRHVARARTTRRTWVRVAAHSNVCTSRAVGAAECGALPW